MAGHIPDASELGTFGGVVAIVLGVGLLATVAIVSGGGLLWIGGAFVGLGLITTGGVAIARGRAERAPVVPALPDDLLSIKLGDAPLPLGVCARCRQIDEPAAFHGRCPRCDAGADYLVVEDDSERQLARSSLGLPGVS